MQIKPVTEEKARELYKNLPENLLSEVGLHKRGEYIENDAKADYHEFLQLKSLLGQYFELKRQLGFIEEQLQESIGE